MNYYVIHPFTISTQPIFLLPLLYAISGKLETKYSIHYAFNWNGWIDWRWLSKLCIYHDMNIHLCLKENVSLVIPTFVNLGSLCWKERNACSIRKKTRRSLTLSSVHKCFPCFFYSISNHPLPSSGCRRRTGMTFLLQPGYQGAQARDGCYVVCSKVHSFF